MQRYLSLLLPLALALVLMTPAELRADHHGATKEAEAEKTTPEKVEKKGGKPGKDDEEKSVTEHSARIGGAALKYQATAGKLSLKTEKEDKVKADVFYTFYEKQNVSDTGSRPITFCFNGGPGSSSVWLHLGAIGPRRVKLSEDGTTAPPPPFRLVDNQHSLLDVSDLVFVDPVSTGYSRADESKPSEFHGFSEDIDSMTEFIRLFVTRHERWDSPKYLLGESYGAIRVAGLAETLQSRHGLYLNGVILLSGVLDFRTLVSHSGSDLVHALYVPAYTAVAHYHGKLAAPLSGNLMKAIKEAETFAFDEYMPALLRGASLDQEKKKQIAKKLSLFTGLSVDFLLDADLRPGSTRFRKELLREEGVSTGRFDGRIKGTDVDTLGEGPDYDPSYTVIYGVFASTLNAYIREELGFVSDLPYEILSRKIHPWNYKNFTNRYVNVSNNLASAMRTNVDLQILILGGHHDLATPPAAIRYSLEHMSKVPGDGKRFEYRNYDGGHMMYTNLPSLKKLKTDLARFYERTANVTKKSKTNEKQP